jgi:hypothetical protein
MRQDLALTLHKYGILGWGEGCADPTINMVRRDVEQLETDRIIGYLKTLA